MSKAKQLESRICSARMYILEYLRCAQIRSNGNYAQINTMTVALLGRIVTSGLAAALTLPCHWLNAVKSTEAEEPFFTRQRYRRTGALFAASPTTFFFSFLTLCSQRYNDRLVTCKACLSTCHSRPYCDSVLWAIDHGMFASAETFRCTKVTR